MIKVLYNYFVSIIQFSIKISFKNFIFTELNKLIENLYKKKYIYIDTIITLKTGLD